MICIRSDEIHDNKLIDFNDYVVLHVSYHNGSAVWEHGAYVEYILINNNDKNSNIKTESIYEELLKKGNN